MANLNLNKVILGGRLTADPELKMTPNGVPVCSFSIAINRRFATDQVDFINCLTWRNQAEFLCKYFRKGSSIIVFGNIQVDTWKDKEGHNRRSTRVIVDELQFGESKNRDSSATAANTTDREGFSNASNSDFFTDMKDADGSDAELPF